METNQCNPAGEQLTPAYEKPTIEIIEMEMESSILAGSSGVSDDFIPGGGGGDPWS